jgi:GTP-binding protein HflX
LFERPAIGERAILVHMDMFDESRREYLDEFRELATSAGANVIEVVTSRRSSPDSRYFIGSGKVDEIAALVKAEKAELVLFNHSLTPSQERNLEKAFECRVLDRTGLILDIFAQRARSHEGKLQVELAQLKHISTRLIRGWTHLERQRGGGGIGMMGPGETQLETDRRLIGVRIKQINKRLQKVRQQREQNRQARRKAEVLTVSLVGYTNAGKSTLFNALTASDVYAEDKLFATLDPTLRKLQLENGQSLILADTVGFIRHLPHDLVESFRSTLQETEEAHLLLHVIDAADEMRQDNIQAVETVLREIGADDVPRIDIMNKIDCMDKQPAIERDESGRVTRIWVSAQTGAGLELIREVLVEYFSQDQMRGEICLKPEQSRMRALLYGLGAVRSERNDDAGNVWLAINLPRRDWLQLVSREHINVAQLLLDQSLAHSLS